MPFLSRKVAEYLEEWASSAKRKPLVLRGARQVGKSTSVRVFASTAELRLVEVNFEKNPEYSEAFSTKDPQEILNAIEYLAKQSIQPGHTLLFLDEIQNAPDALVALRYFYEELPSLHVIAAGSLLDFTLAEASFSMPVGRIEYLHMGPLTFEEFLLALDEERLANYLQTVSLQEIQTGRTNQIVHKKLLTLLNQFIFVGGMPEAVASYAVDRKLQQVDKIHTSILATYRDDFGKYSSGSQKALLATTFDRIPAIVGKKFKYVEISRQHKAAEIASALKKLCLARICSQILHTSANGIPLGAETDPRVFKPLHLDVGLLSSALGLKLSDLQSISDAVLVNKGSVAEQFIGQHLSYNGPDYKEPALHYWVREVKGSSAEVDYVVQNGAHIVPVEVKAGTTGSLKSLHQFLKAKESTFGVRFNTAESSFLNQKINLTDQSTIEFTLLSLPLYMVQQLPRLLDEYFENNPVA